MGLTVGLADGSHGQSPDLGRVFLRVGVLLEAFLFASELHRRVRCLAMDEDLPTVRLSPYFDTRYIFELDFQFCRFEFNQHLGGEVMPVLLKSELHRRVRCLAMDEDLPTVRLSPYFDTRYIFELDFQFCRFEFNQHLGGEVMPVLLKSGKSASREEAVEKRNICRSMQDF
ncbi:hypothetical protein F2Q69_00012998 [Brassica cretica]|uniref:Uncharacterized protein n=1 Tax=Brassica cretica TaxID=69181 RepID=A0A8S9R471_BRACR|nr:hypothetical protein F2Q69_00012998 [Brassica cretica]